MHSCVNTLTGSKLGWITPRLGEAFFTSAMSPGFPIRLFAVRSAPTKSRDGGALFNCIDNLASGSLCFMLSSSCAFHLMDCTTHNQPGTQKMACTRSVDLLKGCRTSYADTHQTISSNILRGLLSSVCGTSNVISPHLKGKFE